MAEIIAFWAMNFFQSTLRATWQYLKGFQSLYEIISSL